MWERARLRDEGDGDMKRKVTGWNQSWNVTRLKEHFNNVKPFTSNYLYLMPLQIVSNVLM